jgi:hypothetical protein
MHGGPKELYKLKKHQQAMSEPVVKDNTGETIDLEKRAREAGL